MSFRSEVKSPCINLCRLNSEQVCEGCWRHIDEIVAWPQLDAGERRDVIARTQRRRQNVLAKVNN
jgi:predicted Fe-S protein YdhL (DUF1289 family)